MGEKDKEAKKSLYHLINPLRMELQETWANSKLKKAKPKLKPRHVPTSYLLWHTISFSNKNKKWNLNI